MDQVKLVLSVLKKHHFWALCGLVVLIGLGVWATATADLAGRFEQRSSKLEGDLKKMVTISGMIEHPNQGVIEAKQKEHDQLKKTVLGAWKLLYSQQKEKNPWPPALGSDFLDVIESLGPDEEIPDEYRETYQNFIDKHLPNLFEIIEARVPVDALEDAKNSGPRGGMGYTARPARASRMMLEGGMGPGGETEEEVEMFGNQVDWNPSDWQRLVQRFNWETRPWTCQVRIAQEDLWVYEALLRIIKATNRGATSHFNAPIKTLEALEIGQDASNALQRGRFGPATGGMGMEGGMGAEGMGMPGGGGMGMEGGMPGGGMPGGGGMGMEGGMPGGGMPGGMGLGRGMGAGFGDTAGMSEEQTLQVLTQGRYVDEYGAPLLAGAEEPYAEFKMMPIRMNLVMDQRQIPELLVQCANSSMPVEVHEIRLNAQGTRDLGLGGRTGGMGGMGIEGMGGEFGGMERRSRPGMLGGRKQGVEEEEENPYDIPVEIVGIIYIYNPPDRTKLGTGAAAARAAAPATEMPGAAPSGTPPAVPAPAAPVPGASTPGTPVPGTPAPGTPAPGTPAPGTPPAATPTPETPVPAAAPAAPPATPAAPPETAPPAAAPAGNGG